jgi:DNA-binding protein HU-beta
MPRKAELVKAIADETGISRKDANAAFNAFVSYLSESVKHGETVSIPGLGRVTVAAVGKGRDRRTPYTGSVIRIPAKKIARFRSARGTNDALEIFTRAYKNL